MTLPTPPDAAHRPPRTLRTTPLDALHQALGARMVAFAGYSLPVQYPAGLMAEHHHTRTAASLFDVSHMGQILVQGSNAAQALESLMPMDFVHLPVGRQRYGLLLNAQGGILDDLMSLRREDGFLLVVNGACKQADWLHLMHHIGGQCRLQSLSQQALLALQGPTAAQALQALVPEVGTLRFMDGRSFVWDGVPLFITRSGYTGEDGFEISVPAAQAQALAQVLLDQPGVLPAGLGARNSLRLEAGLCLYGNDMDQHTTPVEAGLGWAIQKVRRTGGARAGGFLGAETVLPQLDQPSTRTRQRVALQALERIPVRENTVLMPDPMPSDPANALGIGTITSGLLSPTLGVPIALGYVPPSHAAVGTRLNAVVRGKPVPMQVVSPPFYQPRYQRQ